MFLWRKRRQWVFRKQRTRKKRSPWVRLLIGVAVVATFGLIIYGVWYGTRHAAVTIDTIHIEGGETIDHGEVHARASELLRGTYFFLVPKRFAYAYPQGEIIAAVERIPRVHGVVVARTSPKEILVRFNEHLPFALWCRSIDIYSAEPCLFVDDTGYAFDPAPQLKGSAIVRMVTTHKDPVIEETLLGAHDGAVRRAQLVSMREFAHALFSRQGMRVFGITIGEHNAITYHVTGGGDIIVPEDISVQDTFDTLDSVLASEEFAHIAPGNFEYIDLRFENRVLVKEVEETEEEKLPVPELGPAE